jgi:hypothetical protein
VLFLGRGQVCFHSSEQEERGKGERRNNKSEDKGGRGTCYNNHDTASSSTRSFINFDTLFISPFTSHRSPLLSLFSTRLYISQSYELPSTVLYVTSTSFKRHLSTFPTHEKARKTNLYKMFMPTLATLAAFTPLLTRVNGQVTATGPNGPTNPSAPAFAQVGSKVDQTSMSRLISLNSVSFEERREFVVLRAETRLTARCSSCSTPCPFL